MTDFDQKAHDAAMADLTKKQKDADKKLTGTLSKPEDKPTPYHLTDTFNAGQLILDRGMDLRYCAKLRGWYIWNESIWEPDEHGKITNMAQRIMASFLTHSNEKVSKHAKSSLNSPKLDAMVKLARSETGVSVMPDIFDANHYVITCANGVYDLKEDVFREPRRGDFITKQVPVAYDEDAMCQQWEAFLEEIFQGDYELIDYMCRVMGYCLTGNVEEHKFFILYGEGHNGKSTVIDAMNYILGPYIVDTPTQTIITKKNTGVPNDVAMLRGSRVVTCAEPNQMVSIDEAMIKKLASSDKITARFLHKEYFSFNPTFKVLLITNYKPEIRGTDKGLWRRVDLIPFDYEIPEHKIDRKFFKKKLIPEATGILNWMISGYRKWAKDGLGTCGAVKRATMEYRKGEDLIGHFIDDMCEIGEYRNESTSMSDAIKAYFRGDVSMRRANDYLKRRFGATKQDRSGVTSGKRFWTGIRLKNYGDDTYS